MQQRVAIVGSGISGLSAAWALRTVWDQNPETKGNEVIIFEKGDYVGGHTHTVYFDSKKLGKSGEQYNGEQVPVDTGFIVFNTGQYPNMVRFFEDLGVETAQSDMSFSLSVNGIEWGSDGVNGLFAQRSNILSPTFWRFVWDMLRFNNEAVEVLNNPKFANVTLGEYVKQRGFSNAFLERYLLPMTGAIWSTPSGEMLQFPIQSMITFMQNHKLLQINDRYLWRTVTGGSIEYVKRVVKVIGESNIRLNCGVASIERKTENNNNNNSNATKIIVTDSNGKQETFDKIIFACHADTTRKILEASPNMSQAEKEAFSCFTYKSNKEYLHTDRSLMPKCTRAWTSWNVISSTKDNEMSLTYWMNRLQTWLPQGPEATPVLITLNPPRAPAQETILGEYNYEHPVFSVKATEGQKAIQAIQGENGTFFAGAYLGYGFHEDGFIAGLLAAQKIAGAAPFEIDLTRYAPQQIKPKLALRRIQTMVVSLSSVALVAAAAYGARYVHEKYFQ